MTKSDFEGLYQIYLRCFTGKMKLRIRGCQTRWPVSSMNKEKGIIVLSTPSGLEHYRYAMITFPDILDLRNGETAQDIADRINRNEKLYV